MTAVEIHYRLNGELLCSVVKPQWLLAEFLRDHLGLTGTKIGCGKGECGSCTVLLDGKPVNSCLMLAVQLDGHELWTIEGLSAQQPLMQELHQSFIDEGAVQCGFCTPGMLISAYYLLTHNCHPDEEEIKDSIMGNLCRCTGYQKIIQAIQQVAHKTANVRERH